MLVTVHASFKMDSEDRHSTFYKGGLTPENWGDRKPKLRYKEIELNEVEEGQSYKFLDSDEWLIKG